jgi:acetate kinase
MNILVLNAGSASLKFEVIATPELPFTSDKQHKLVSGIVEGIGEEATFSLLENKQNVQQETIAVNDYDEATRHVLKWLNAGHWHHESNTHQLDAVGHRIVHGGE